MSESLNKLNSKVCQFMNVNCALGPLYVFDISAAMGVFERLLEIHQGPLWLGVEYGDGKSPYGNNWQVWVRCYPDGSIESIGEGATPMIAICEAAVKLGNKK